MLIIKFGMDTINISKTIPGLKYLKFKTTWVFPLKYKYKKVITETNVDIIVA